MPQSDTYEIRMQKRLQVASTIGLFAFPILGIFLFWLAILSPAKCIAIALYGIMLFASSRRSLIEINWNPSPKMLRDFGLIGLIACPILGGIFYWLPHIFSWFAHISNGACLAIAVFGIFLFAASRSSLVLTRWIFIGLTIFGAPIGFVVGIVVLGIVFFGLLTPVGLAFRLAGRDPLRLRRDPNRTSHWQPHTQIHDLKRYFRPF
jgi:hypothetical protein